MLALAGSLTILIGVLASLWLRPATVSAGMLLEQAQAASRQPATVGLQSYQTSGTITTANISMRIETWYQTPNQLRAEICPPDDMPGISQGAGQTCTVIISDGTVQWTITPTSDQPTIVRESAPEAFGVTPAGSDGQMSLDTLLTQARTTMDAEVLGSETVAGRATYVIGLRPKSTTPPVPEITSRLWIDQEYFVVLGWDIQTMQMKVTSFTSNPLIDRARFMFTPPAGVPIRCLGAEQDVPPCAPAPAAMDPDLAPYPEATPLPADDPIVAAFERSDVLRGAGDGRTATGVYSLPLTATIEAIRTFYGATLADKGWTPLSLPAGSTAAPASAAWTKGDELLNVILMPHPSLTDQQILIVSVSSMGLDR
jgi:outer membrane lipoprotein-sorting protein